MLNLPASQATIPYIHFVRPLAYVRVQFGSSLRRYNTSSPHHKEKSQIQSAEDSREESSARLCDKELEDATLWPSLTKCGDICDEATEHKTSAVQDTVPEI